jgi:hypothetical protein
MVPMLLRLHKLVKRDLLLPPFNGTVLFFSGISKADENAEEKMDLEPQKAVTTE